MEVEVGGEAWGEEKCDAWLCYVDHHRDPIAYGVLGLREGQTIAVRDVILGLITRSANDAAVVAAEGLSGSERGFAGRRPGHTRSVAADHRANLGRSLDRELRAGEGW